MICWLSIKQNADLKQLSQDPIGHPIMHLSGIKHATGEAIYCDDMPVVDRAVLDFCNKFKTKQDCVSDEVFIQQTIIAFGG